MAVRSIAMVTGCGPQSKVMTPPFATARTTAREVQEAGVPVPTTVSAASGAAGRGGARARHEPPEPDGAADATTAATTAAARTPARHHSAFSMSLLSFSGSVVGA